MAKVTGALFSLEASGKFANALVFDRRGFVRSYSRPTNPQTAAQGNVRQVMLATQRAVGITGATTKTSVKALAPTDYRWNSYLVQQNIGTDSARWDASLTAFNALAPADQTAWNDEATALGIEETHLPYAGDPAIPNGATLFAYARALFRLGLYTATGAPDGTNAAAWAADITS